MRGGSLLEGGALSHPATATAPGLAQGSVLLRALGDRAVGFPLPALRSFRPASRAWQGRPTASSGTASSGAGAPSPRSDRELRSCIWGQSGTLFQSGFLKEGSGARVGNRPRP